MPVTKTRVVLNGEGDVVMIVLPDWDEQLQDPGFSPPGCVAVDVPKESYDACAGHFELLVLLQSHMPGSATDVRRAVSAKIKQINDGAAAKAEADLLLEQTAVAALPIDVLPVGELSVETL